MDVLVEESTPQRSLALPPRDFRLYTAAADVVKDADRPRVQAVGSSTALDLQGDIMEVSALQDMEQAEPGLLCFLNHSYNIPEDVVGALATSPKMMARNNKIVDLGIVIDMETDNPRAARTYSMIAGRRRLGISGGFMVDDYEFDESDDLVRLHIKRVRALEFSIVGIPANQRSWVEYAARGLFTRTLDERLAPIVRNLFPKDYEDVIGSIEDAGLRKHLDSLPMRRTKNKRVIWVPGKKGFALHAEGRTLGVSEDELVTLFDEPVVSPPETTEPDETRAATDEEKQAQEARSKKYGIGIKDGGHITKPSDYTDVDDNLFADPVNYRYPLDLKARADNAASRWGDASNRSQYSSEEQAIISKRIEARQAHFGEDNQDDVTPDVTKEGAGHGALSVTHSHSHTADGSQGDDASHDHEHTHTDNAIHQHSHEKGAEPEVIADALPPADPEVPPVPETPVTPPAKKARDFSTIMSERQAIEGLYEAWWDIDSAFQTSIWELLEDNGVTDKSAAAANTLAQFTQAVLAWVTRAAASGVFAEDDDDETSGSDDGMVGGLAGYSVTTLMQKALRLAKAGAEFSGKNKQKLQAAHDDLHSAHDGLMGTNAGLSCGGMVGDSGDDGDPAATMSALPVLVASLDGFTKALEKLEVEGVTTQHIALKTDVAEIQQRLTGAQTDLKTLLAEVERVSNQRLGRPIPGQRSIAADEPGVASAADMGVTTTGIPGPQTGEGSSAGTTVLNIPNRGTYRHWPDGVGKGQRPALTDEQKRYMTIQDIMAYRLDAEALVPERSF